MVKTCKFNYKVKCNEIKECEKCAIFKKTGQQTLGKPKPKPKKAIKRKGHTVYYYELEAGRKKR